MLKELGRGAHVDFMEAVDTADCRDRNPTLFKLRDVPADEVEAFADRARSNTAI